MDTQPDLSDVTASPAAPATLTPGRSTSEAWLTFLAMIIGGLPSLPWIESSPIAVRIVGMLIATLAALGYGAGRVSLKRAHLIMASGGAPPRQARSRTPLVAAGASAVIALLAIASMHGCSAGSRAKVRAEAGSAASSFIDCAKVKAAPDVLAAVAQALVGADYQAALDALLGKLGNDAVACAVQAVMTVTTAGKSSGAAALSPIELRALEEIKRHGWTFGPGGGK